MSAWSRITVPVLVLVASLGNPTSAFATPAVDIVGNDRTKNQVILSAAELSDDLDDASLAEARQRIMNLRLFETVEVARVDVNGNPTVTIKVKERWTLFPIPFVSSTSRGTKGGVFVIDTNLFGLNKIFVIGGSYASWGGAAILAYQDPSVAGTRAVIRFNASYAQNDRELRISDQTVDGYHDERTEASLLGGYRITPRLTLAAGWYISKVSGSANMDTTSEVPAGGWTHGPAALLEYRGADFKMYYDDGPAASITYKQARTELGAQRDVLDVSARAQYTRALVSDQATSLIAQLDLIDGDPMLDARLLGGRIGTRGFEQQTLWVDRAATITLDHQIPVLMQGWGIWTAAAFVDAGRYSLAGVARSFITPGAGVRLYLPRMNFPALGFDVSYSTQTDTWFTAVSVGLAM